LAFLTLVVGALLALAAHEFGSIHAAGRRVQDAAGIAALAGAQRLGWVLRQDSTGEEQIEFEMRRYAARNSLADGDALTGYYVDAEDKRLGLVGSGLARDLGGIEVIVTSRADTFLTKLLGLAGWPIQRSGVIRFEVEYPEGEGTPIVRSFMRTD
jgi:hypothetical protein